MKNIRGFLLAVGFCFFFQIIQAQDEEPKQKGFDKSKLFFGGNFCLSFRMYSFVNVSPQVGYMFNK